MRNIPRVKKENKKGIILLSGGLDSTVTLYIAKRRGYRLTALIFSYGQKHKKEIQYAKKVAQLNRIEHYVISLKFPWVHSSLTDNSMSIPTARNLTSTQIPSTYVAGRNLIFLSYAASLADSMGARRIFIGAHTQDYSGYPDCRPTFFNRFEVALQRGLKRKGIKLITPLINKNKREIIKIGLRVGVPFQLTWSCYKGEKKPCLVCDSCRFRLRAFQELGMVDPLLRHR